MNVALLISAISIVIGLLNTLLVAGILLGKIPRAKPVQPSVRTRLIKVEPEPEVVNALEEWPEWTVPVELLVPKHVEEELPGDPEFRVMVQ